MSTFNKNETTFFKIQISVPETLLEDSSCTKSLDKLQWRQWTTLLPLNVSEVPSDAGLYQLRWAINGKPRPIPRAYGIDAFGFVYFGKAKNLNRRLKALLNGIIERSPVHNTDSIFLWYGFEEKFKHSQLEIRWSVLPKDLIDEYEYYLLSLYVFVYLDLPPLNIAPLLKPSPKIPPKRRIATIDRLFAWK